MAKKKIMDKLAQDAAAALAAGMTYGKWKAMQDPVTVRIEMPKLDENEIACLNCGVKVKQCASRNRKYCGPYCAREYNRKMKAQEIEV